jgi:hypothetical protein
MTPIVSLFNKISQTVSDVDYLLSLRHAHHNPIIILLAMKNALENITEDAKAWLTFQDVWLVQKLDFLHSFKSNNPVGADFIKEVTRYQEIFDRVQSLESFIQVSHFVINYLE